MTRCNKAQKFKDTAYLLTTSNRQAGKHK